MATEKSFLTKIREKELEVSVKIDDVRVEADQMIERARKDAQAIFTSSETEGKKAADDYVQREMKQIQADAERTRFEAKGEVDSLLKKGEKNIPKAVEKIIGIMLSG
jgi:vacuolar-type H+-ATPase subunit H